MSTDYNYGIERHKCGGGKQGYWIKKHEDKDGVHYRCTGCGKTKVG